MLRGEHAPMIGITRVGRDTRSVSPAAANTQAGSEFRPGCLELVCSLQGDPITSPGPWSPLYPSSPRNKCAWVPMPAPRRAESAPQLHSCAGRSGRKLARNLQKLSAPETTSPLSDWVRNGLLNAFSDRQAGRAVLGALGETAGDTKRRGEKMQHLHCSNVSD